MTFLFEVSWEVCNKVGGIYTVIESKAEYVKKEFKDYYCIGPYFKNQRNIDFEERKVPEQFKQVFEKLQKKGVVCHFGSWASNATPTILIDFAELAKDKNAIKTELWNDYKIDSLYSSFDFDEPVCWSTASGMFLEEFAKTQQQTTLAQFHEWLAGAGILYLKKRKVKVATTLTIHATVLERAMAWTGDALAQSLKVEEEAYKRGVHYKHQLEKAAALNADIFTAVSEPVSKSAEKVFGRKPEVIVLNGMDMSHFPNMEEIPKGHQRNKEKLKRFTAAYFFPFYTFDLEKTLFFFTAGRYEFHAKGLDVIIKALGTLNKKLKEEGRERKIVFFMFVPAGVEHENMDIVESNIFLNVIEEKVEEYLSQVKEKVLYTVLMQKELTHLFNDQFIQEMKKMNKLFKKSGSAPLSTHKIIRPESDAILQALKTNGLENKEEDSVKIILYPAYLDANDGLLDMDYYEVIWGCQLGVFPSFYEPWGYTPVESAAFGVPSITTDVSGFGKYVEQELKTKSANEKGIMVIKRENKTDEEVVQKLYEEMYWYANLSKNQRIKNKIIAESFIMQLSWRTLIQNYFKAYSLALEKKKE
jgi:glycogen(starch) synthase